MDGRKPITCRIGRGTGMGNSGSTSGAIDEPALYRRLRWRLVPYLLLLYVIAWFDRVNISFAALQMNADLGLGSAVFGFGAGLAGMAGIIGATFQSLSPGEDTRFLLASLVVVIVGGMGSIVGAALGALIIGVAEQMGFVYAPTYSIVLTFLIMAAVLAFRPQGLLGTRR